MRKVEVWATALACCCVVGCSSTTQQTARQLEAGDIVLSGGLDEPGFLYVPRLSAQLMYGIGVGDLSVHAGTTIVTSNVGLGSRFYLGEKWNAGLQLDANGIFNNSSDDLADFSGLYSGTLRLTTSARKKTSLYGGFHLSGHTSSDDDRNFEPPIFVAGGVGGLDILAFDNFGVQLEIRLSPLILDPNKGVGLFPVSERVIDDSPASLFIGQLGFSIYKRWGSAPAINGSVPEERWNDPGNDFDAAPINTTPRDTTKPPPSDPMFDSTTGAEDDAPVPPPPEM